MPGANEALSVDKAVRDPAPVVGALVDDHDQPPAAEPRHRDRHAGIARAHDLTHVQRTDVLEVWHPVIRVIAELVEELCGDRAHHTRLGAGSDSQPVWACWRRQ